MYKRLRTLCSRLSLDTWHTVVENLLFMHILYEWLHHSKLLHLTSIVAFPGGSDSKAPACSAGDPCSIPGLGRSPGEGNGNPVQYSCLENSMGKGAWQATAHGVAESDMTEQLTITVFKMTVIAYVRDTENPDQEGSSRSEEEGQISQRFKM